MSEFVLMAGLENFTPYPDTERNLPCGKRECRTTGDAPYYPRKHSCLRDGCGRTVESACPILLFCSGNCFSLIGKSEQWSNIVMDTSATHSKSDHAEEHENAVSSKRRNRRPPTETQKERRKEVNRRYYEKIKKSGRVHEYRRRFIEKRREENRTKKTTAKERPEENCFLAR